MPVGRRAAAPGAGDVEGDVGGERGLAHGGTRRKDDEIGALQPAHQPVEVGEAGGGARERAVALVGFAGHLDGFGERHVERLEAAVIAALFSQIEQRLFRFLDLLGGGHFDVGVIGGRRHFLADLDQRSTDRKIVDGLPVVGGVEDGGGLGREAGKILRDRDFGDQRFGQVGLDRDRRRRLAGADDLADDLVDLAMHRLIEMLGHEEIGDAVEGLVVDQNGAQQRLLGLDVVRGEAKALFVRRTDARDV